MRRPFLLIATLACLGTAAVLMPRSSEALPGWATKKSVPSAKKTAFVKPAWAGGSSVSHPRPGSVKVVSISPPAYAASVSAHPTFTITFDQPMSTEPFVGGDYKQGVLILAGDCPPPPVVGIPSGMAAAQPDLADLDGSYSPGMRMELDSQTPNDRTFTFKIEDDAALDPGGEYCLVIQNAMTAAVPGEKLAFYSSSFRTEGGVQASLRKDSQSNAIYGNARTYTGIKPQVGAQEFFQKYASDIGMTSRDQWEEVRYFDVKEDAEISEGNSIHREPADVSPEESTLKPYRVSRFNQKYKVGAQYLEVLGAQYIVKQGLVGDQVQFVQSVTGKAMEGLNLSILPKKTEAQAYEIAKQAVKKSGENSATIVAAAEVQEASKVEARKLGKLAIGTKNYSLKSKDARLVWVFDLEPEGMHVEVDAITGAIIHQFPNKIDFTEGENFIAPCDTMSGEKKSCLATYDNKGYQYLGCVKDITKNINNPLWCPVDISLTDARRPNTQSSAYPNNDFAFVDSNVDAVFDDVDDRLGADMVTVSLEALEYYSKHFNWVGFDGKGEMPVMSRTERYLSAKGKPNACYDRDQKTLVFHSGSSAVTMFTPLIFHHEYSHAINDHRSPLLYLSESGALNEAQADYFGLRIIQEKRPNEFDWCLRPPQGYPSQDPCIRHIKDPKSVGDPNTYGGQHFIPRTASCTAKENDTCGVHHNSTIITHLLYRLMEGESGTNDLGWKFSVNPVDPGELDQIVFAAFRDHMTPAATFFDARRAMLLTAQEKSGYGSKNYVEIMNSFHGAGIGSDWNIRQLWPYTGMHDQPAFAGMLASEAFSYESRWHVQISTDPDFKENVRTDVVNKWEIAPNALIGTPLEGKAIAFVKTSFPQDTQIYWRMYADSNSVAHTNVPVMANAYGPLTEGDNTDWGEVQSFHTRIEKVELVSPADGAHTVWPDLKWKKIPGVKGYEVVYGTDQMDVAYDHIPKAIRMEIIGEDAVTAAPYTLWQQPDTYYWKVRGFIILPDGEKDYSAYSDVRSVTTDSNLMKLKSPANGATSPWKNVKLEWENPGEATAFDLYLYDEKDELKLVENLDGDTSKRVKFQVGSAAEKRSWKVRPVRKDEDGNRINGVISDMWSLTIDPSLTKPQNLSPNGDIAYTADDITLKSSPVPGAVMYRFALANATTGAEIGKFERATPELKITSGTFLANPKIRFRMRAIGPPNNEDGEEGLLSEPATVTMLPSQVLIGQPLSQPDAANGIDISVPFHSDGNYAPFGHFATLLEFDPQVVYGNYCPPITGTNPDGSCTVNNYALVASANVGGMIQPAGGMPGFFWVKLHFNESDIGNKHHSECLYIVPAWPDGSHKYCSKGSVIPFWIGTTESEEKPPENVTDPTKPSKPTKAPACTAPPPVGLISVFNAASVTQTTGGVAATGPTSMVLSWNPVSGAQSYDVKIYDDSTCIQSCVGQSAGCLSNCTKIINTPGTSYAPLGGFSLGGGYSIDVSSVGCEKKTTPPSPPGGRAALFIQ